MTDFKPGDRVRVAYTGEMDPGGLPHVWAGNDTGWVGITKDATVELIERADDPSKDPIGTVRRANELVKTVWIKQGHDLWISLGEFDFARGNEELTPGFPIIGAVPGTPAWDAWLCGELSGAADPSTFKWYREAYDRGYANAQDKHLDALWRTGTYTEVRD